jgi:hypothetical protein
MTFRLNYELNAIIIKLRSSIRLDKTGGQKHNQA